MLKKLLLGRLGEIGDDLVGLLIPGIIWGYAHFFISLVGPILSIPVIFLPIVGPIPASLYGAAYSLGKEGDQSTATLIILSLSLALGAIALNFILKFLLGKHYYVEEDGRKQGILLSVFHFIFYVIPLVLVLFSTLASSIRIGGIVFGVVARPFFPDLVSSF